MKKLAHLIVILCVLKNQPVRAEVTTGPNDIRRVDPAALVDEQRKPDANLAYKSVDGIGLPMAVFLPDNRASLTDRRPAVLCIHGGAWSGWQGGDCQTWNGGILAPHARYFSARGVVGVTISYRNVFQPTKDKAAFEQGPGLADLIADCRSAMRFLRVNAERFGIDPDRIAVLGDSAGGHLAACLGTIDRFDNPGDDIEVRAMADLVIACNPITDLTDPAWFPYLQEVPRAIEGDKPLSREQRAKAVSPLWNVNGSSAPTLAIHGLADGVVLPRHSSNLIGRMANAGVRSELTTIPEASHAFVLLGYRSTGSEFLAVMRGIDRALAGAGYLAGKVEFDSPKPRGLVTRIRGDQRVNGRIPGTNGIDLLTPEAWKSGVTTVTGVEDAERGNVLKVHKGTEGLVLTGCGDLGGAGGVSLWIKPESATGTLLSRMIGSSTATGYKLTLAKNGVLTWQVAGVTLTAGAPPLNAWSHVVISLAPDRAALYLNGTIADEQPLNDAVLIGSHFGVGEGYAGLISDLEIFDQPGER